MMPAEPAPAGDPAAGAPAKERRDCKSADCAFQAAAPKSPSVENPSGGASVAYFFYSSPLGYFENILVRPFDEGRAPLQDGRRVMLSNGFLLEK